LLPLEGGQLQSREQLRELSHSSERSWELSHLRPLLLESSTWTSIDFCSDAVVSHEPSALALVIVNVSDAVRCYEICAVAESS
jgi:hypothetical protein